MKGHFENKIEKEFQRTLKSEEFLDQFQHLQSRYKELKYFASPEKLLHFLHDQKNKDYQTKDKLFQILITDFQKEKDDRLALYLIGLLLPGLRRVFFHYSSRWREIEKEELWSQIVAFCLEEMEEYDFAKRSGKIAKNIIMDVFGQTFKWIQSIVDYQKAEQRLKEELLPDGMFRPEKPAGRKRFKSEKEEAKTADIIAAEELLESLVRLKIISCGAEWQSGVKS